MLVGVTLPGVGVRWPAELGLGWCPWLRFRLLCMCEWCMPAFRWGWCSLGGEIGSLLILTGSGDEAGGGVLLDTARCGSPLVWASDVGIWWLLHDIGPRFMSGPMLKSWAPNEDNAPG